jgi:hypothetical protein
MDELGSTFLFQTTLGSRFHGLYPSRTHLPMAPERHVLLRPYAQRSPAGSGSQNMPALSEQIGSSLRGRSVASGDAQSLPLLQQLTQR